MLLVSIHEMTESYGLLQIRAALLNMFIGGDHSNRWWRSLSQKDDGGNRSMMVGIAPRSDMPRHGTGVSIDQTKGSSVQVK